MYYLLIIRTMIFYRILEFSNNKLMNTTFPAFFHFLTPCITHSGRKLTF